MNISLSQLLYILYLSSVCCGVRSNIELEGSCEQDVTVIAIFNLSELNSTTNPEQRFDLERLPKLWAQEEVASVSLHQRPDVL